MVNYTIKLEVFSMYAFYTFNVPYYPYFVNTNSYIREFPPVNPSLLKTSAKLMESLLQDALKIVRQISSQPQFAQQLMTFAQLSKNEEVNELIKHVGIKNIPLVTYNPDGLHLAFQGVENNMECCKLDIAVRWRI